jgi:hypothetical protein
MRHIFAAVGWKPDIGTIIERSEPRRQTVGDNACKGAVRKRAQLETKTIGEKHWTKRSKDSGQFMDQKKEGQFKGVRREK